MRRNAASSDAWVGQFVDPRSLRWILVAALALFFLDLALVLSGALDRIDHDTLVWVDGLRSASGDRVFQFITDTGTGYRRAAVLVLATVFFAVIRQRRTAIVYLAMGAAGSFIAYFVKSFVQRERPQFLDVANLPIDSSFPSGHALGSTIVYGMLVLWLWHHGYRVPAIGVAVWILLICFSRMYFGVHFPTDVFAAVCLGVAYISVMLLAIHRWDHARG